MTTATETQELLRTHRFKLEFFFPHQDEENRNKSILLDVAEVNLTSQGLEIWKGVKLEDQRYWVESLVFACQVKITIFKRSGYPGREIVFAIHSPHYAPFRNLIAVDDDPVLEGVVFQHYELISIIDLPSQLPKTRSPSSNDK